jgi:hypothetical protein
MKCCFLWLAIGAPSQGACRVLNRVLNRPEVDATVSAQHDLAARAIEPTSSITFLRSFDGDHST